MNGELTDLLYQSSIRVEISRVRSEGRYQRWGSFTLGPSANFEPGQPWIHWIDARYLGTAPKVTGFTLRGVCVPEFWVILEAFH